jgi:hypothetical protein
MACLSSNGKREVFNSSRCGSLNMLAYSSNSFRVLWLLSNPGCCSVQMLRAVSPVGADTRSRATLRATACFHTHAAGEAKRAGPQSFSLR